VKKAVLIAAGIAVFILLVWVIAIPQDFIKETIESSVTGNGFYLRADGLQKGLFYNFSIGKISIGRRDSTVGADINLLTLANVKAGLDVVSCLTLSPKLFFEAEAGGGIVKGQSSIFGRYDIAAQGKGIEINDIATLKLAGIDGDGKLAGNFTMRDNNAELKFSVSGANIKNTVFPSEDIEKIGVRRKMQNAAYLPLSLFESISAYLTMNNENVSFRALNMQGKGVYARLKGSNEIEVMLDSSFKKDPLLEALMSRYYVSPGYYIIPLSL
jgi:type II secretion system protein N